MTTLSWIRGVNGTLGRLAPEHVAGKLRGVMKARRILPATCSGARRPRVPLTPRIQLRVVIAVLQG